MTGRKGLRGDQIPLPCGTQLQNGLEDRQHSDGATGGGQSGAFKAVGKLRSQPEQTFHTWSGLRAVAELTQETGNLCPNESTGSGRRSLAASLVRPCKRGDGVSGGTTGDTRFKAKPVIEGSHDSLMAKREERVRAGGHGRTFFEWTGVLFGVLASRSTRGVESIYSGLGENPQLRGHQHTER